MPSKLKKAIAAVKDQTSISLAKVKTTHSSSNLEVAVLKATTHEETPINPHHVDDILRIVSSNRSYAAVCARALARRIGRTRNWIVALKSLLVVLRLFQDGDPHFPKEVLHAMKRGYKILNLSTFRHDSSSSSSSFSFDFAAFVRSFAAYLDERLQCFLTGKLQRRISAALPSRVNEPVRDMKPAMLLDRIAQWQRLLDRAIAMGPTEAVRSNCLVRTCLYAVAQESFELYRDVSDGLALLLESFFHLHYASCVIAYDACVKASRQFDDLAAFYDLCRSSGVGRPSDYPKVQKITMELVDTLREFLKDQSSFPASSVSDKRLPPSLHPPPPSDQGANGEHSGYGRSHSTSLEDLIGTDEGGGISASETMMYNPYETEMYSDPGDDKPPPLGDYSGFNDSSSVMSDPDTRNYSGLDFMDNNQAVASTTKENRQEKEGSARGWELALLETATQQSNASIVNNNGGFEADFIGANVTAPLCSTVLPNQYNPFLEDSTLQEPIIKMDTNVGNSGDDFFASLGPNTSGDFWADFNDNGIANGGFDPFAGFDNAGSNQLDFAIAIGGENLNAPETFPNTNVSTNLLPPSDEFASLNCGTSNVGSTPAEVKFGFEPIDDIAGKNPVSSAPTFRAAPTFKVKSGDQVGSEQEQNWEDDPFGSFAVVESGDVSVGSRTGLDEQNVLQQQQLWLKIQNQTLSKHLT